MVLGGGGSSAPMSELLLQLLAALVLPAWLMAPVSSPGERRSPPKPLILLALIVLVLPVIQLIPLPPAVWQSLPGRQAEISGLRLVGDADTWMPWSMAPASTLASLLATIPPVMAMLMAGSLDRAGRWWLIVTIAAAALTSVLFGALQLSAGVSGDWRPYGLENVGYLNGFQANRNAEVDVLLIGLGAAAAASFTLRSRRLPWLAPGLAIGTGLVLTLGCILTGSRAGIAILPVALILVAALWLSDALIQRHLRAILAAMAVAAIIAGVTLHNNQALDHVAARFARFDDARLQRWQDTRYAIHQYWPVGSGVGTFKPILIAAERLEIVTAKRPVRAHNDYLEFALEGGAASVALLLAAVLVLAVLLRKAWAKRATGARPEIAFAVLTMVTIALHSIVDYPLRSMALAQLAAVAAGVLAGAGASNSIRNSSRTRELRELHEA
jgi:O-antigen ligase